MRYIPELRKNLISLDMLESDGLLFKSKSGMLYIFHKSILVMKDIKKNGLYALIDSTVVGTSSIVESNIDKTRLWYLRL